MTSNNAAAKTESPEGDNVVELPRVPPNVRVEHVKIDLDGQATRRILVRLPEGATADDVQNHPGIWRKVQGEPRTSLRQWDDLLCVAYDESFYITGRVVHADRISATLGKLTLDRSPARMSVAYECADYYGRWVGDGYANFRKADDQRMDPLSYANEEAGRQGMLNLYSKKGA